MGELPAPCMVCQDGDQRSPAFWRPAWGTGGGLPCSRALGCGRRLHGVLSATLAFTCAAAAQVPPPAHARCPPSLCLFQLCCVCLCCCRFALSASMSWMTQKRRGSPAAAGGCSCCSGGAGPSPALPTLWKRWQRGCSHCMSAAVGCPTQSPVVQHAAPCSHREAADARQTLPMCPLAS